MASPPTSPGRRPLPTPPVRHNVSGYPGPSPANYSPSTPTLERAYAYPSAYPSNSPFGYSPASPSYDQPTSIIPGGTMIHKGFYDLLNYVQTATPSPSRILWGGPKEEPLIAGARYEDMARGGVGSTPQPKPSPPQARPVVQPKAPAEVPLKKGRRISKDMVSSPTNFKHLVHASDAMQAEILLSRWGPDGMGKLGDPYWALPIKNILRKQAQAKAVAEVVSNHDHDLLEDAPLRVVNGYPGSAFRSTPGSSPTVSKPSDPIEATTEQQVKEDHNVDPLARGTIHITQGKAPAAIPSTPSALSILPNSSSRGWIHTSAGLKLLEGVPSTATDPFDTLTKTPTSAAPQEEAKLIIPSLTTLERAISAKIYFENLYFPLLRLPPSREQRRLALEADLEKLRMTEEEKEDIRVKWRRNETDYLREKRVKVRPEGFTKLKVIGHGAFGVVYLVRERSTGQLYAMKQLRKTDMLRKGQEGHVRAERDVLKSAALVPAHVGGADWIVKLHYSFQDSDHLYLVLEFMGGGDLLNLLIERDTFEEEFTRFYIAEMILAIEQCHKQGFIHRDIKPDNFLFDPNGHIKLSDFGLATDLHWAHDTSYYEQQRKDLLHKYGIDLEDGKGAGGTTKTRKMNKREVDQIMGGGDGQGGVFTWREKNRKRLAYSVCGTNSYMSPEVIRGQGYTFSCDWWSLGVIMFECLYGYPPFVSNSRHITRQKILNWRQSLRFPTRPHVSREGVDLMQRLLCEPEDRIGSQPGLVRLRPDSRMNQGRPSGFMPTRGPRSVDGAEFIKEHPWFRGIDWENIHRYPAPFRPELRNPEDTRHFDPDIPAEPLAPANGAAADATRDPMLLHEVHGAEILSLRKATAFAGFTHKSPRAMAYTRIESLYPGASSTLKPSRSSRNRAMSL
ncbi:hypothetical protein BOTBODRAFT_25873 [Botryobasidium botryosum FD-172 SS1]|uniref:non-specific serine/threonine protein kinase n=1 Tax=Botryobasidium botryosum (strain FD-172 SS1) TaxID=930990 RepID=A0A067N399_BOTB1|nr:hypothetical protein BOTBODRAFT_25873 [Botryobasidium botryosum FD-172 SS1]